MTHLIDGEAQMIRMFVSPGAVVFDVGAFEGEWSALALTTAGASVSHMFEPNPGAFERIQSNMKGLIDKEIVIPVQKAVSNVDGETAFWVYDTYPAMSTIHKRDEEEMKSVNIVEPRLLDSVETLRIDTYCDFHSIDHIDFLKIDTEGNEMAVLEGSEELLSNKAISCIQFEYGKCFQDADRKLEEVFALLRPLGYRIAKVHPYILNFSEFAPELENYDYCNFIAVL